MPAALSQGVATACALGKLFELRVLHRPPEDKLLMYVNIKITQHKHSKLSIITLSKPFERDPGFMAFEIIFCAEVGASL